MFCILLCTIYEKGHIFNEKVKRAVDMVFSPSNQLLIILLKEKNIF